MESPSILGSAVSSTAASAASPRKRRTRAMKSTTSSSREGVAEREHRHGVAHLAEGRDRRGADARGRAVGAHERGKARLDGRVALAQRVVVGVGDLRRVLRVVELVVVRDLAREPLELGLRLRLGQLVDGLVGRTRRLHARETASARDAKSRALLADFGSPASATGCAAQAPSAACSARSRPARRSAPAAPACPRATADPAAAAPARRRLGLLAAVGRPG